MIRFFLNKQNIQLNQNKIVQKQQLLKLLNIYKFQTHFLTNHMFDNDQFLSNFTLTLPQRQQCFCIYNFEELNQLSFTAGKFLNKVSQPAKFYKRSIKNIGGIVMNLKKEYLFILKRIFLFKVLNLNYKQWLFWEKFNETIHPSVKFFLHKKSYLPRWQGKRRIKRVVLRMLNKQ